MNSIYAYSSYYSSSFGYVDVSSYSSSADYYFSQAGKFSYDSYDSASSVSYDLGGNLDSVITMNGGDKNESGVYRIENDRLWLFYPDGTRVYKTFYVNIEDGKKT